MNLPNSDYSESLVKAIFSAMRRDDEQYFYYNKETKDVLQLVEGYLSSKLAHDQSAENKKLLYKIQTGAKRDAIITGTHYLIPRLGFEDYLLVFKKLVRANKEFLTLADHFQMEFGTNNWDGSDRLFFNDHLLMEFFKRIQNDCGDNVPKLMELNAIYLTSQRFFSTAFLDELN